MNQIPNFLIERVRLSPDRIAIVTDQEEISFKQLHERVVSFAGKLKGSGIKKRDHVSVLMKNSIDFIIVVHALHYLGAIAILLNTRLSEKEIGFQLENSDSAFLIIDEHQLIQVDTKVERLEVNALKEKESIPFSYEKHFHADDVATMMFTSGTTGAPKAVLQTFGNHWSSAIASVLNLGLNQDDSWLINLPMFHVGGLSTVYKSAIYGMKIVLTEKVDSNTILKITKKHRVTILSVVTKVLNDMITEIKNDDELSSVRAILLGGGPAPLPLLKECQKYDIPVYQTYGMTETCSQIATLSPEYMISKIGSAGKALYGCSLEIRDNEKICEPSVVGEIVVKGPNVCKGYYRIKSFDQSDYFYTGDLGYFDEDGFLYVVDRRSDLIISGGENIYPAEIESVLLSHPDILEAGVTGKEDAKWGRVPVAFVVSNSISPPSVEELVDFCRINLAGYKVPKEIHYVKKLPRNATNKLVRKELLKLL